MSANNNSKGSLEALLSKYIAVWIWSILFGTLTGLTYSFLSSRIVNWGPLALLPAIPLVIGIWASLLAWRSMYKYLINYLIPSFIHNTENEDGKEEIIDSKKPARWLRQVFLMMIVAITMRLVMELIIVVLGTLQ